MARGVNKVILVGRLGQDPDCRSIAVGRVANVSIATTTGWKDKNTGENKETTEWHRVVMFGGLAGVVEQYLKKGSQVYIEGRLQTDKWADKNGVDRYTTKIICSDMQMLGGSSSGAVRETKGNTNTESSYQTFKPPYVPSTPQQKQQSMPTPPPIDYNDDVPF